MGNFLKNMQTNPLEALMEARAHGDVVLLGGLPWKRYYLVSHPDEIETLMASSALTLNRGPIVRKLFGEALFMLSDGAYEQHHKVVQPAYREAQNPRYTDAIAEVLNRTIVRWEHLARQQQPLNLSDELMSLARSIIVKAMFGIDVEEPNYQLNDVFIRGMNFRHQRRWGILKVPLWWPTQPNRQFQESLALMKRQIDQILEAPQRTSPANDTFLSKLLQARDAQNGARLSDQQLKDEVMMMFTVGHLTTGAGMTWMLYEVMRHPAVMQRLQEECSHVLKGDIASLETMQQLTYTTRVFHETLRLHPPVWSISRKTTRPVEIGPYRIPANSILIFSPFVMHHHPAYWDQPELFDPDRFEAGRTAKRHKYVYCPFGIGQRQCLGRNLAITETLMVVSALIQHFRMVPVTDTPLEAWGLSTLLPKEKLFVKLDRACMADMA